MIDLLIIWFSKGLSLNIIIKFKPIIYLPHIFIEHITDNYF